MKGREDQKAGSSAEPEQGTGVQGERQSQELQEALPGQCGKGIAGCSSWRGLLFGGDSVFSFSPLNLH